MVGHDQFPMFRLATLLARQLSAPVASRIKEYAKRHPRFGRAVCMRAGRLHRGAELRFKLWTLNLRRPARASLPPVSDDVALGAGADILGEVIIFTLGAAIVVFEVNRQAEKQEVKVAAERSAWVAATLQLHELRQELELQRAALERLRAALATLARRRGREWSPAPAPGPSPNPSAPVASLPPPPPPAAPPSLSPTHDLPQHT